MAAQPGLRRTRAIHLAWLLLWSAAACALVWRLATAWPYSGSMAQLGLALALPGVLYRACALVHLQRAARPLRGWPGILLRLLALPLGVALAAATWSPLEARSMKRFEASMKAWVAQIGARMPSPCTPAARYDTGPALKDYLHDVRGAPFAAGTARGTLHHDGRRFVVAFMGGSADFDGSTVSFDSAVSVWSIFHNDQRDAAAAFQARVEGLNRCAIALP